MPRLNLKSLRYLPSDAIFCDWSFFPQVLWEFHSRYILFYNLRSSDFLLQYITNYSRYWHLFLVTISQCSVVHIYEKYRSKIHIFNFFKIFHEIKGFVANVDSDNSNYTNALFFSIRNKLTAYYFEFDNERKIENVNFVSIHRI